MRRFQTSLEHSHSQHHQVCGPFIELVNFGRNFG